MLFYPVGSTVSKEEAIKLLFRSVEKFTVVMNRCGYPPQIYRLAKVNRRILDATETAKLFAPPEM